MAEQKKNKNIIVHLLFFFIIAFYFLFFSGCSMTKISNNVEVDDSCKDFDLSSYNLYQLEAELVPQPEFRDYLKENFIRKKDAKPFNYNIYHGIMVEKEKNQGEDIERESLEWDEELTCINYIDTFNVDYEKLPENVPMPTKNEIIKQGKNLLKEFSLNIDTNFELFLYDDKYYPHMPTLYFVQNPEGFPISTRQHVDGITTTAGLVIIGFYGNRLHSVDCIRLLKVVKKEPFSTVQAIPQNTERISTMVLNFLRKLGDSANFKIEDISIVYDITEVDNTKYTLTPMIEVKTIHKKEEDRIIYHYHQIDLNTGTIDIW